MTEDQRTRTDDETPASGTTWRDMAARADWGKIVTDGMIYLLAVGGFYLGYKTLYKLAIAVGYSSDQAPVAAALADIAILAYSLKAVREIKEGRSAWGIRLIVAAFSLATFTLQLKAAWPHPTAVGFHIMPPAVWILGHEMMLRGRLRTAKAKLRAEQIAAGLRPAKLPSLRLSWWFLDPFHTLIVWRLKNLWQIAPADVIRKEAADRQKRNKSIPRAWLAYLDAEEPEPEAEFEEPEGPKVTAPPVVLQAAVYHNSRPREEVSAADLDIFQRALPDAPVEGRPEGKATAYIRQVQQFAVNYDIKVTNVLLGELLGVDPSYVSRLRKVIRDEDLAALNQSLSGSTPQP
jgi:hypothetical protein